MNAVPRSLLAGITLLLVMCGCGRQVPASRQELEVGPASAERVSETHEYQLRVPIGPDSTPVVLHWTGGTAGAAHVVTRAYAEFPAHARSVTYSAQSAGMQNTGSREAPVMSVTVVVTYKSKAAAALDVTRSVFLGADGGSIVYSD